MPAEQIENATTKFNAFIKALSSSALFHAALVTAAAVLVAVENKWPTVKEDIAAGLLLLASVGKAIGPVMNFFKPADTTKPE